MDNQSAEFAHLHAEAMADLRRVFGYAPNEADGEKWVVFRDRALIVVHPERRPRIYRQHGLGPSDYYEIEPLP